MENFEKTTESKMSPESTIKQAIESLPTEILCINPEVDGTMLGDTELRLKELMPKITHKLHSEAGHAVVTGEPNATPEESKEFADLLRIKGGDYSKFASLLDSVADTENDTDKYLVDASTLESNTKENIKKAIEILPTELLCIDSNVDGTMLGDTELRLKELVPKVIQTLHIKAGNAVVTGKPEATTAESQEFANLLREKGSGYSKFASLLESVVETKPNPDEYLV